MPTSLRRPQGDAASAEGAPRPVLPADSASRVGPEPGHTLVSGHGRRPPSYTHAVEGAEVEAPDEPPGAVLREEARSESPPLGPPDNRRP